MKKQLAQVAEFHKAFNIPILSQGERPTQERINLRKKLMKEEIQELDFANDNDGCEEISKEACDVLYVICGTILEFGWQSNSHIDYMDTQFLIQWTPNEMPDTPSDYMNGVFTYFREFAKMPSLKPLSLMCMNLRNFLISKGLLLNFERCFNEVHRSNMSKLDANGKPIYRPDGKVLKSDLYKPADLSFLSKVTA